jgi:aspartyl protease family protein
MSTQRTGSAMYLLAIGGFIALMSWLFSAQIDQRQNPNRAVESDHHGDGGVSITLKRNRAGHYVVTGRLNDTAADFLLDTGATDVAISPQLAARAGLVRGPAFSIATANGTATGYATRIGRVAIGGITEYDVAAVIAPNLAGHSALLGMSFLKRLDFSQRGDELRLHQRAR